MDYIVNNKTNDEIYKGISRQKYPDWIGWKEIDRHKSMRGFPDNLKFSDQLIKMYEKFFDEGT